MVHQLPSEGPQEPWALIKDTLRPESNPHVISNGKGDDVEPEQTALLKYISLPTAITIVAAHHGECKARHTTVQENGGE